MEYDKILKSGEIFLLLGEICLLEFYKLGSNRGDDLTD